MITTMAPALSPEDVLMNSFRPFQQAVDQYGQGKVDAAKVQVAQQFQQKLQEAHLEAENKIAMARDKMYLDREDKRAKAGIDRMDAREHGELIRNLSTKIISAGGALPTRAAGMSDADYANQLANSSAKLELDKHNGAITALDASQKKITELGSKIDQAVGTVSPNDVRTTANQMAVSSLPTFYKQLDDTVGVGAGDKFQKIIASLGSNATPEIIAAKAAQSGVGSIWSAYYSQANRAAQKTLQADLVSKSTDPNLRGLYKAYTDEQNNFDRLSQLNPAALSDWSVQKAMAKEEAQKAIPAIAAAVGVKPPAAPATKPPVTHPLSLGASVGGTEIDNSKPVTSAAMTKEDALAQLGLHLDGNNQIQKLPQPMAGAQFGAYEFPVPPSADPTLKPKLALAQKIIMSPHVAWKTPRPGLPGLQPSQVLLPPLPAVGNPTPQSVMASGAPALPPPQAQLTPDDLGFGAGD